MARTTAVDWLDKGLYILREAGTSALTIERLCQELGKTKGSFYHHFKDMNTYVGQLLDRWRHIQTQVAIDVAESAEDPHKRLEVLDQAVRTLDHRLDQIIRAWAIRDPRAAEALADVDKRRVNYLIQLLQESGAIPEHAKIMAELEYVAFLGAQQLYPDMEDEKAVSISFNLREALTAWHQHLKETSQNN